MKHLLSEGSIELLAQFAWSRVLLAFDYDGTLAPIVANRDAAAMRVRTRTLLHQVCQLYPTVVISGRSQQDVAGRLEGLPLRHIIGNHGLEPSEHIADFENQVARMLPALQAALAGWGGVEIEDKRYSLAVHYRRSRQKREARKAVFDAVADLKTPVKLVPGKLVINVVPDGAPHKGDALVRLRKQEGADTAVFVGDDVTDEDVFEMDQPGRLLSIRVGRSQSSAAGYFLRDQSEVDRLLARLASLRAGKAAP